MPQQTFVPNTPNGASNSNDDTNNNADSNAANRAAASARDTASATRARVATQSNTVPPAARGVGTTGNKPDCSQMRGIEKSECERRDTSRDDLPAGVTTTQPPQLPQPPQAPQPPR